MPRKEFPATITGLPPPIAGLNLFSKTEEHSEEFSEGLTEADIEQCLYSLADNNSNLRMNRDPCEKMIR